MNKIHLKLILFLILSLILSVSGNIRSQSLNTSLYQYLSPVPDAQMVMPSTGILIRCGKTFSPLTTLNLSDVIVKGEKSGPHQGTIKLLENGIILSFVPSSPFVFGENVTVELKNKFKLTDGGYAPHLKYNFRITEKKIDESKVLFSFTQQDHKLIQELNLNKPGSAGDSLPDDFPEYTVVNNNPSDGYIFFAPFTWPIRDSAYLIISDNYGVPVFYKKLPHVIFDFQKQVNGNLTYFDTNTGVYYELNKKYQVVNSYNMQNGYGTDFHELRVLENGHSLMLSYDPQQVRMDTIVVGGDSAAIVRGLVLQELDENKNVIFQWRSWDHFKITDATEDIDLTAHVIDYVHANAIEVDYDGNILVSCRHMDEVTKINRITGNIIWRWGGNHCKNNQFIFLNDSTGFSHQHCIRRLPNGNYTIFDNGNLHSPQFSRAVEYQMDEVNRIVTLVWENRNNPVTYTDAMGSVQRLGNHNTLIGWGSNSAPPSITEVSPDGIRKLAFIFPDTIYGYRAFRYNWDTDFFTSDKATLDFGVIPVGGSGLVSFNLTNNDTETVEINSVYNRNSAFVLMQQLPVVIPPQNAVNLSVKFRPDSEGVFADALHLRWETEGQRIVKVLHLIGVTDSTLLDVPDGQKITGFSLSQNYPNPFNPVSRIRYSIPYRAAVKLQIFDLLGREISTLVNKEQQAGVYEVGFNGSNLASGIYIYRLNAGEFISVKKMLLLK